MGQCGIYEFLYITSRLVEIISTQKRYSDLPDDLMVRHIHVLYTTVIMIKTASSTDLAHRKSSSMVSKYVVYE